MRKRNGFTLVELLIVLAIVAIIVFLLVPAIDGYFGKEERFVGTVAMREHVPAATYFDSDGDLHRRPEMWVLHIVVDKRFEDPIECSVSKGTFFRVKEGDPITGKRKVGKFATYDGYDCVKSPDNAEQR